MAKKLMKSRSKGKSARRQRAYRRRERLQQTITQTKSESSRNINSSDARVNIVFEYTTGGYVGNRFFSTYPLKEIERVCRENERPGSRTKVVAVGVSSDEASRLCHEALLLGGFNRRMDAIVADPDIPPEMKEMEAMTLAFALRFGG